MEKSRERLIQHMVSYTIWHVSRNRTFPLNLTADFPELQVRELNFEQVKSVVPEDRSIHLFFFQVESDGLEQICRQLDEMHSLLPFFRVVLVSEADYRRADQALRVRKRLYLLDDAIRSGVLQMLLGSLLQIERYRQIIQDFSTQLRIHRDFIESFSEMIQKEMKFMKNESEAYQHLLEFEQRYRVFEESVNGAINEAFRLKEHEMIGLKDAFQAMEKLQNYRDKELQQARDTLRAAEIALDLSREENMERDRMIMALQNLNIYTDAEVVELARENDELRARLGMPPRRAVPSAEK